MKKIIYAIFAIAILLSACKKEGCTDPNATNYSSDAKKDDGSCIYSIVGNWILISYVQDTNVTVTLNGVTIDSLSGSGSVSLPQEEMFYGLEFLNNGIVYAYTTSTSIEDTSTWELVEDSLLIDGGGSEAEDEGTTLGYTVGSKNLVLTNSVTGNQEDWNGFVKDFTMGITIMLERNTGGSSNARIGIENNHNNTNNKKWFKKSKILHNIQKRIK